MTDNILKKTFPNLSNDEITKIHNKISDKCNDFYFIEFLKATNCNINDAYKLLKFDEELRSFLLKYLLRFEIQIKSDFMTSLVRSTKDEYFWNKQENYIFKNKNEFDNLQQKIKEAFNNLNISFLHKDAYGVAYVISFGTFVSIFKNIDPVLKVDFIKKYTKKLFKKNDFFVLYKYLLCIRALRNRCAHGTHIVSNSFVNQLNQYSFIKREDICGKGLIHFSIFELTIKYMIDTIYSSTEFKDKLILLLNKYKNVYSKYGGKQSINPMIIEKISK